MICGTRRFFRFTSLGLCLLGASGCSQFSAGTSGNLAGLLSAEADSVQTDQAARLTGPGATRQQQLAAARSLEQRGQLNDAVKAYVEIAAEHGDSLEVHRRLAVLYDTTNQFDQSARHYLAALQMEPEDADLLCDYGYSRYLQGDLGVAEQVLRRALAVDPDMARAHNNLGLVLTRGGRHEDALAAFAHAGCSPTQARFNLAYALISGGDWQAAQQHLAFAQQSSNLSEAEVGANQADVPDRTGPSGASPP